MFFGFLQHLLSEKRKPKRAMLPNETALVPYSPDSASGSRDGGETQEQEQGQMIEISQQSLPLVVVDSRVEDLTEAECPDSVYMQHLRQFLNSLADEHREMFAKIQTVLVENLPLGRTRTPRQFKLDDGKVAVSLTEINSDAYVECGLPLTAFYFLWHFHQAQHISSHDMHYHVAKYLNNMASEILQRKNRNEIIAREIPDVIENGNDDEDEKTAAKRSQGKRKSSGKQVAMPKTKQPAVNSSAKNHLKFNGSHTHSNNNKRNRLNK